MNLAFARQNYTQVKNKTEASQKDGYKAVKVALNQVISSMEDLQNSSKIEEKETHFERALTSIYFLQKCLDFDQGGDLAKNLFKVYEYCRQAILSFTIRKTEQTLDKAIQYIKIILEGWDGIEDEAYKASRLIPWNHGNTFATLKNVSV